jgi:pimeloyl-ACP methyl ester carboxylesterase
VGYADADGIRIAYETFGSERDETLLLIAGLGAQGLIWHEDLCELLAEEALRVVRFDNRDSGRSSLATEDYGLSDLAADAVSLHDHLEVEAAHLAGASMGGAIAQTIAVERPERARSLTSIMSSTGDPRVGRATRAALYAIFGGAPPSDPDAAVERIVAIARALSPRRDIDEGAVRLRAAAAAERGFSREGFARQLRASLSSPDRTEALRALDLPAVVLHGDADPLVDVSGGRAVAAAIPGAELRIVEHMGHELPRAVWPEVVAAIREAVTRARR